MAFTRSGKLQFSEEQYKTARYDSSALEYARAHSYDLVQQGRHFHLRDHDSMIFTTDGRWYWNSRGVQGGAIELLMHYESMTLPQAVLTLCGEDAREQVRSNDTPRTWPPRPSAPQRQTEGEITTAVNPNDPTTEVWTVPPGKLGIAVLDHARSRVLHHDPDLGEHIPNIIMHVGTHTIGLHNFQAQFPDDAERNTIPACKITLDDQLLHSVFWDTTTPFNNPYLAMRHVVEVANGPALSNAVAETQPPKDIQIEIAPNDPATEIWLMPPNKLDIETLDNNFDRVAENALTGRGIQTVDIRVGDHTIQIYGFRADIPNDPDHEMVPGGGVKLNGFLLHRTFGYNNVPFQDREKALGYILEKIGGLAQTKAQTETQVDTDIAVSIDPNDPTTEVWAAPPGKLGEVDLDSAYLRITENVEAGKGIQTIRIQVGEHTIGLHGFQADVPGKPDQFLPACCIALDGQVQFSGRSSSDPFQNKYDALRHVLAQTGMPGPSSAPYRSKDQAAEKVPFSAPPRGKDFKRLFAYLVAARGLDYDIVSQLVKEKLIYASDHRPKGTDMVLHNVAFVGLDEQGVMRSAFVRGCSTMSSFKMEVAGSDKTVPFVVPGREVASRLYVFEAAIDSLSHASVEKLSGQDWQQAHRLSQGGNAPIETITRFLETHPRVTEVVLCMDNDAAGQKLTQRTQEQLVAAGYGHLQIRAESVPLGKDWNDYLKVWRSVLNEYEKHPTTQGPAFGHQTCVGRIHALDPNGKVTETTAFTDPAAFQKAAAGVRRQECIVVETPEQIEQVHRNRTRHEKAREQARTSTAEEAELGA